MPPTAYVSNDGNDYVALAPQSAAGTPATATSAFSFFRWLDDTAAVDHDRVITTEREGGVGQDLSIAWVEHHTGRGNLAAYARPDLLTRVLGWLLGAGSVTSAASTLPYTHDLWPVDQARLLTYEAAAPQRSVVEQLVDSKLQSITIEGEHGKPIRVTAALVGGGTPQARDVASARTVTLETSDPFFFNTGSYNLAISGAPAADDSMTRWSVTFERSQDEEVFGVGYGRQAIPDLNRNVTVEGTRRYQSATAHNAILYGSGGSVAAASVATGMLDLFMSNAGAGTALRTFRFVVPLMQVQPLTRNVFEVDGQTVYEDFAGVALKSGTHLAWARVQSAVPTSIASGLL